MTILFHVFSHSIFMSLTKIFCHIIFIIKRERIERLEMNRKFSRDISVNITEISSRNRMGVGERPTN